MPSSTLRIAALAAFVLACACSTAPESNNGVCDPPCNAGKVCRNGTCVKADGGSGDNFGDGGEIIIPVGQDAGQGQQGKVDSGMQECTGTTSTGQLLPLDMYVMLDQSGSMSDAVTGGTKWSAVTSALESFLQTNTNAAGMSVGIQYFGLPGNGQCNAYDIYCSSNSQCGQCGPCAADSHGNKVCWAGAADESCTAADYATADVEIASLTQAQVTKIDNSIGAHGPSTNTPTSAALQGAINHARSWAQGHAQHVVIVILATDGDPTECDVTISHIEAIAAAGVSGSPKILTFVIGVGASLGNMNGIAKSGASDCAMGTCSGATCDPSGKNYACLVDTGGDVNSQFLAALNKIRGTLLGCTYLIPPPPAGKTLDFAQVNVQYTPGNGGAKETLVYVTSQAACASTTKDAWYYDNAAAPTQIIFCDATCTKIKADTNAKVDVQLGCSTVIN